MSKNADKEIVLEIFMRLMLGFDDCLVGRGGIKEEGVGSDFYVFE